MSGRVKDTDRGFRALQQRLRSAAKGAGVSVGVHADAGAAQHEGEKGSAPVTVLDVALWNEFGLGVPERSFLRSWVDENESVNRDKLRRATVLVVKGEKTFEQAMNLIGLTLVGGLQKSVALGIPPPNAPSTVAKKGSSTPLINTGQLRQSITYKVER